MTFRTLNYGNYGIFLLLGNAGFISSTVEVPQGLIGFRVWGLEFRVWGLGLVGFRAYVTCLGFRVYRVLIGLMI